jgi:hypothetical protein
MMDLIVSLAPLATGFVLVALLAYFGPRMSHRALKPSKLAADSLAFFAAETADRADPGPAPPGPSSPSF